MAFYFHILTTMHGQNHIKFVVLGLLYLVQHMSWILNSVAVQVVLVQYSYLKLCQPNLFQSIWAITVGILEAVKS